MLSSPSPPLSLDEVRALFDGAPVGVAIVRDGLVLYANPRVRSLMAVGDDDVVGRNAFDFVAPDERGAVASRDRARSEQGFSSQPTSYEVRARRADGQTLPVRVEVAPLQLPDGIATIAYAFDLSLEERDRQEIEALLQRERRGARHARQLQELSAALAEANLLDGVASTSLEVGMAASGALGAVFVVPARLLNSEGDPQALVLLQSRGYALEAVGGWSRMSQSDPTPVAFAQRSGQAVWLGDTSDENALARFPLLESTRPLTNTQALIALPMPLDERVVGVLGLSFDAPRVFDEEERTFWLTFAGQCAQAIERVRLDSQARDLARRQRESLALLNTLLDSAPVGFGLFDRDHRFVLVNEELARISGAPIEAHIGRGAPEMLPSLAGTVDELLECVWQSGQPSEVIEFSLPHGDSETRTGSLALYPVRVGNDGSEVLGVGAIFIETTERQRGDRERERLFAQLEVERARLETLLQQMPSAVVLAEAPSGRVILGNTQAEEMLSRVPRHLSSVADYAQFAGYRSDGSVYAPDEWPLARALRTGEVVRGEEISIPIPGSKQIVIRANAAPIRDREGRVVAGVLVFDSVTERARANAAQRFLAEAGAILLSPHDERETFQELAELCVPRIADWCVVALSAPDESLHSAAIAHANSNDAPFAARLRELLKRDPRTPWNLASVVGSGRAALYSPDRFAALRERDPRSDYAQLSLDMGVQSAIVAPLVARERVLGTMFWLQAESGRSFDASDIALAEEVARRAALSADNARLLQEAQAARDAAQRARDEAQSANRAKDEFLAVVSHELRTPLTPILGWLELLRSPGADEALREQAYAVIERNANAQAQLVNDILDVSRITTGKLRLELKDVTLDELVSRSVESLRTAFAEKHLRACLDLERGLHVRADANRLGQVVWNLLQNALKFTPPDGQIFVELHRVAPAPPQREPAATQDDFASPPSEPAPRVRLTVRDTGQGIEPEFLGRVFDRFQQGDSSSTRKAGGLGLGLAIVKHITELHGGRVEVHSPGRGQGATFSVELPLLTGNEADATPVAPASDGRRLAGERLKGVRIVVVDDEPDTREMLARLMDEAGATVRVAPSGQAALDIVPQFAPNALICDIGMPAMDGIELRRALLARGQTMPAIALTAYASASDEALALEAGFQAYLAKPVGALKLVEVIEGLVHPANSASALGRAH